MTWLLLTCFLLWARHGEGGALKCVPDKETGSCLDVQQEDISQSLEVECLAGSEWESNCHLCRCSGAGAAQCVRLAHCDLPNTVEPIRCKPNTTFERGCNTCVCLDTGLGLCTLKNCQRIPAPAPSKANLPSGSDCAPGTTWKSQCNDCVCSPEGLRRCTEKACPDRDLEPLLRCAPHSLWKKECNTCWCTSDGRAMCTKIGCVGIPSDMHFSDEDKSTESSTDVVEMEQLPKVPDFMTNTVLESNENNPNGTAVLDTEIILKDLDDNDNNLLDRPLRNKTYRDAVQTHAKNENFIDPSIRFKDEESSYSYKKIHNELKYQTTEEIFPQTSEAGDMLVLDLNELGTPYKNQELQSVEQNFVRTDSKSSHKRLEEMSAPYTEKSHIMHHILKRSVCKPNQDFQNECNTCKCSATGQSYSCTQNECMEKDKEDVDKDKEVEVFMESEGVDHIERHSVCKPRATFFVGCNPCTCNVDGTDFSCTNKPCQLPEDVEVFHELNVIKSAVTQKPTKVCVENRMFIMNCNTCWCNEDGTSYFCTRKVCTPELPGEPAIADGNSEAVKSAVTQKPTKKVCVENRMFIMNCNTCWCNEDGTSYFCTRKVCVPELSGEPAIEDRNPEKLRIIMRECRPDEVFELDCNMCRCNADGKSFSCTRRACVDEDNKNETRSRSARAAPQEPPKSCQPGQEFRMDCNKCLCDNEGQDFSCTRIDCSAINNNNNGGTRRKRDVSQKVSADCVPGSVFDQGCNVCRCTEDGGHATCTLKRCARAKENSTAAATESSFRCTPGEQFKQSCNDCSCSADGKSVFCTLLVCDEDVKP